MSIHPHIPFMYTPIHTHTHTHTRTAGCLVRRRPGGVPPGVATLLGFLFQLEESLVLWLMWRVTVVPYRYLVRKDDASENDVFFANTLKGGLAVGIAFSIPPLAGASPWGAGGGTPPPIDLIVPFILPTDSLACPTHMYTYNDTQPICTATTGSSSGFGTT